MTWWSWTRRHSPATPCRRMRSHAAALSSSAAGGCSIAVLNSGAPAIRQVTFHAGGESVSRTIKHKAGVGLVVAPRRYVLDTIIAAAAQQAGADVRTGVTVTGVQRDGRGRVTGYLGHDHAGAPIDLGGRYVIGADGLRSRVARSAGAAITQGRPAGGAAQYAYYTGIRLGWHGALRRRTVVRRGVPDPRRAGMHLGLALPPLTRRRSAAGPGRARRPSASCSGVPPRSWPSGCATHAAPRRCRACCASPTRCARHSARAGRWSAMPVITVTPSPPTASATRSATPSSWPPHWTRH